MKKIIGTLLFSLLLANMGLAKSHSDQKLETAKQMYAKALKSENDQIRLSAVYLIAQFKYLHPEMNFGTIEKQLYKMALKDESDYIRANAMMTLIYMNDANLRQKVKASPQTELDDYKTFYNKIYTEASNSYWASVIESTMPYWDDETK
ncbi:hypothetical protein JW960_22205 [candidate division KSB1 bacterium]|nr:hypothetical protein [candidate division KSB1 bacterium]